MSNESKSETFRSFIHKTSLTFTENKQKKGKDTTTNTCGVFQVAGVPPAGKGYNNLNTL